MKSAQNFMKFGTVVNSSVLNTDISIEILDISTCYIFGQICFQKLKMLKNLDETQFATVGSGSSCLKTSILNVIMAINYCFTREGKK